MWESQLGAASRVGWLFAVKTCLFMPRLWGDGKKGDHIKISCKPNKRIPAECSLKDQPPYKLFRPWNRWTFWLVACPVVPVATCHTHSCRWNYNHRIFHQVAGWISLKMKNIHSNGLPSGKRLHSYGKSQLFIGKSTISMAIFNSYVTNYGRVSCITSITIFSFIPGVVYPI